MTLIAGIERTLYGECGFGKGQSIVVACSGGADSVCLLDALHRNRKRWGISRLGVYHLNHQLRGSESDADREFVSGLADSLGLPYYGEEKDVAAYASSTGKSLEMAGRKLRYEGLSEVLKTHEYDLAALGHTASDNVEWILLSVIRGRAEPLLWGIPARRDSFIRPLIRIGRQQIMAYFAENDLSYRKDSSNDSEDFVRNRIRKQVLPLLKELNPSLEDTVNRTLVTGDYVNSEIETRAREIYDLLVRRQGQTQELDTSRLCRYNPVTQLRVIRLFVPWLSSREICEIFPLRSSSGTREIARRGGRKLISVYGKLALTNAEPASQWEPFVLDSQTEVVIPELSWRLKTEIRQGNSYKCLNDEAYFDAQRIDLPLTVRPWREGDRVVPFGRHTSVKLKKIFADCRVPREERIRWPVVCTGDDVLWVVGLKRSALAPVTELTREVMILKVLRGENGK